MRLLPLKTILPYLAIICIPGIWASPTGNVALTDTEALADIDPQLVQRGEKGETTPLGNLLTRTYEAGSMINGDAQQNDQIRYVGGAFGSKAWEMSYWNPAKDLVVSFVTAKGAGFVMIPLKVLSGCVSKNGPSRLDKDRYRETIYEPLFGQNGYLFKLVHTWTRNGKENQRDWWFPDGLLLVTSSPYRVSGPNHRNIPMYTAAVEQFQTNLRALWTPRTPSETLDNILGHPDRFDWRALPFGHRNTPFTSRAWSARNGFAITWDPSTTKYEVWLGAVDTENPAYMESQEETGLAFKQWGYYPGSVYPLSMPDGAGGVMLPGPGAGCKDICETD